MPAKMNKGGGATQTLIRPAQLPKASTSGDSPGRDNTCVEAAGIQASFDQRALLESLRDDISQMFKAELKAALGDDLNSIKSELKAMKTELSTSIASVQTSMAGLTSTVADMEQCLSTCTDDITAIQGTVKRLSADVERLENKCEDLESRSRRNNIRIIGIPEDANIAPNALAGMLKEAFGLDAAPRLDRAHRTLQPKPKPGQRPRAVIARLHYFSDSVDILRKARELRNVKIRDMTIAVFPDLTAKTARERAAFNNVRRRLREIPDLRFGILHPACLRVTYKGVEKEFKTPEEADAYLDKLKVDGD
uniref:L1 transposable element RRM domain-containing protein n=1 Tax=Gouania willdenowi TaxID=441366 RepID=A0A8C5H531_GOUWI